MNKTTTNYPYPEEIEMLERRWFEQLVEEGKLQSPEMIEELPEDFVMEDNESVVVESTTK